MNDRAEPNVVDPRRNVAPQTINIVDRGGGHFAPYLICTGLGIILGILIGVGGTILLGKNLQLFRGPVIETRVEAQPLVIKATSAELVDKHIAVESTTEIDDQGFTSLILPFDKKLELTKRYARGNGGCLIGTDNQKFQPYFEDSRHNQKPEALANDDDVTLVYGEPEVVFCGLTVYEFRDGPSAPFMSAQTPLYNKIIGESLHQVVCAGNDTRLHNLAVDSMIQNLKKFLGLFGVKNPKVRLEKPKPPEVTGTPVATPNPSVVPDRACQQAPPPRVIPTPT